MRATHWAGIVFRKGRWAARLMVKGQLKYLGAFDSEELAAQEYYVRVKEAHNFATLNFLPDGSPNLNRRPAV